MDFKDISDELKEKAKACQTPEELLALAKEEGLELTEEQMEGISGGVIWCDDKGCDPYHHFLHC